MAQADYLGRRYGMGIGCMITVVATFLQAFPPAKGRLACFMVGRVFIGVGTAFAISTFDITAHLAGYLTHMSPLSCWPHLYRRGDCLQHPRQSHVFLADVFLSRFLYRVLDQLCLRQEPG
jgi:hypothetical protein